METLLTICIQCNAELGRFRNSWNGIGNSYHSPVYPPVSVDGLEATGPIYNGAKNSYIEHSHLQDIACIECQAVVGLRCESAPEGHMLKENQLIVRLTTMYVISEHDGEKAKISILRSFPLSITSGKRPTGPRRAATAQPSARSVRSVHGASTPLHTAVVSRKPNSDSCTSISSTNVTMLQVTRFKDWAEGAISNQQKHIDRISGTVDRIERDMRLFREFMHEARSDLSSSLQVPDSAGEEDLSALREDLDELRKRVESNGQDISRASDDLPGKSLEAIANDVEQVSQKVIEVDELKSALARMRARVELLERDSELFTTTNRQQHSGFGSKKRRNSQLDDLRSASDDLRTDSLQKKRNVPLRSTHGQESSNDVETQDQQTGRVREVIEILSSEHDPTSPSRGQGNKQDRPKNYNNTENSQYSIPNSTSSTYVLEESSGNRQVPTSLQTHIADKGPSAISRTSTSRIEVSVPSSTARAMSLQQQAVPYRDDNGVLFLPNGRVDGRSLRFKKQRTGKENIAPDSREELDSMERDREWTPFARSKVNGKATSASASARQDSVSPGEGACEGDDGVKNLYKCGGCGKEYRHPGSLNYHHSHSGGACSRADDDIVPRNFQCEKCKKVYSVYQSLEYHRKHSNCNPTAEPHASSTNSTTCNICNRTFKNMSGFSVHKCVKAITPALNIATRETVLAERERLVRATLERELGR
ncbi:hypothetical protein ONS95_005335 [Cadophora gregata]|uniref:uncharacterized protein n=1 Tax=Cadophora gregata TaxID=51156 RepID=UPI0026DA8783|nr:uncharacterized protein ONS95_005335 [Cadophora gregata]KAK0103305.1 hypothetical protein ONS95_005335 [Cadophora gregata]KAK0107497.1 hypothetical protein ONS96_003307 [Cadophora gregata f. sp. sojae]